MNIYLKVNPADNNVIEVLKKDYELEEFNTKETAAINGKPFLVSAAVVEPQFDPVTQHLGDWAGIYNATDNTATYERAVLAKSQEQLDQDQADIDALEDHAAITKNAAVRELIKARPAQIDNYIDNNVTDLASAKEVLKILAKAVSVIGKATFK